MRKKRILRVLMEHRSPHTKITANYFCPFSCSSLLLRKKVICRTKEFIQIDGKIYRWLYFVYNITKIIFCVKRFYPRNRHVLNLENVQLTATDSLGLVAVKRTKHERWVRFQFFFQLEKKNLEIKTSIWSFFDKQSSDRHIAKCRCKILLTGRFKVDEPYRVFHGFQLTRFLGLWSIFSNREWFVPKCLLFYIYIDFFLNLPLSCIQAK